MEQPGKKFIRGTVQCFGYTIPYAEAGQGDVLISFPGSAGLEMSTAKDMLSESFRVIEFEPPGWGETPALQGEMKQAHLAIILAAAITELGIEKFHLMGTSMGCTHAFWLAKNHQDRVLSLTLEAPMLFYRPEDLVQPDESFLDAIRSGDMPIPDFSNYPAPPPHPNKPWATTEFFREQMTRRFKMFLHSDHPADQSELQSFASSSSVPTKMLLGSEDEILNPCYADRFKSFMPQAKVETIETAIHDIQNSLPEAFVAAIKTQVADSGAA